MKYLLPLLLLAGCESFPEEKEEPHFMDQAPIGEMLIDDEVDDSIKVEPSDEETERQLEKAKALLLRHGAKVNATPIPQTSIIEIDVSFFTHRRYMVYIDVIRS